MKLFIELWQPNATWKALSRESQRAYLDQLLPKIEAARSAGLHVIGWGRVDRDVPFAPEAEFIGIYGLQGDITAEILEKEIDNSGWYRYFECVHMVVEPRSPEKESARAIFEQLLGLEQERTS